MRATRPAGTLKPVDFMVYAVTYTNCVCAGAPLLVLLAHESDHWLRGTLLVPSPPPLAHLFSLFERLAYEIDRELEPEGR
jgi:hypothetical protein